MIVPLRKCRSNIQAFSVHWSVCHLLHFVNILRFSSEIGIFNELGYSGLCNDSIINFLLQYEYMNMYEQVNSNFRNVTTIVECRVVDIKTIWFLCMLMLLINKIILQCLFCDGFLFSSYQISNIKLCQVFRGVEKWNCQSLDTFDTKQNKCLPNTRTLFRWGKMWWTGIVKNICVALIQVEYLVCSLQVCLFFSFFPQIFEQRNYNLWVYDSEFTFCFGVIFCSNYGKLMCTWQFNRYQ